MTTELTATMLSPMEMDVIGEVMNISMGSGATAMSTVLDAKVNITTPRIEVVSINQFDFSYLEPVIGVSIKYVEGIDGTNVLLLKEEDLKRILCHLLSMDNPDEVIFDEIATSAVCEIMNQMMGSSASALAQFLGKPINISPPEILDAVAQGKNTKELFQVNSEEIVSIKFDLNIDGVVESEFISVMEPSLVREIVTMTMGGGIGDMDLSGIEEAFATETPAPAPAEQPQMTPPPVAAMPEPVPVQTPQPMGMTEPQMAQPAAQMPPQPQVIQPMPEPQPQPMQQAMYGQPMYQQPMYQQPMYQQPMQPMPQMAQMPPQQPQAQVNAVPYTYKQLGDAIGIDLTDSNNLELVMSVPIQITVELGTTKKKIKDIVELCQGNIVELDRQAGDQVDILANGRLIAKGDVVVVDDNYSVRVTEIIKREDGSLF